ncbi:universal stress protein [Phytomonospora sp. NPDC050363]|uniref:universal stress protein n=1 Tax=Phytomonospora sp. NPDC050363 TaxID=3155642 RepID=UPI0033E58055
MRSHPEKLPVVVGVDEDPESVVALRWAAEEAAATSKELVVVHAFEWLTAVARLGRDDHDFPLYGEHADPSARTQYVRHAEGLLETAAGIVAETGTGVGVSTKNIEGRPFEVLSDEARDASLLVLGSHGRGLLGRMLLGSVSNAIASDPPCPVAVIRPHTRAVPVEVTDMPVVVGFDATAASHAALAYAAEHAALRGATLVVVHAFQPVGQRAAGSVAGQTARRAELLRDHVAPFVKDHPALKVTCIVTEKRAAQSLVEWSTAARLVVVGTSGRRSHTGSVSQAVLHHSWSPVAVVPEP